MKAGTKKRSRVEQSCSHIDSSDYTVSQLRQLLLKVLPEGAEGSSSPSFVCTVCQKSAENGVQEAGVDCEHLLTLDTQRLELHCSRCQDYVYLECFDEALLLACQQWLQQHGRNGYCSIPANDPGPALLTKRQRLAAATASPEPGNPTSNNSSQTAVDAAAGAAEVQQKQAAALAAAAAGSWEACVAPDGFPLGLRGLNNLGNTCFMNSVLQVMLHAPLLRSFYLGEGHDPGSCRLTTRDKPCLSCQMDAVFGEVYSGKRQPFSPAEFLYQWWRFADSLAGYQQQDAHEFYLSLLEGLSGSLLTTPAAPAAAAEAGGDSTARASPAPTRQAPAAAPAAAGTSRQQPQQQQVGGPPPSSSITPGQGVEPGYLNVLGGSLPGYGPGLAGVPGGALPHAGMLPLQPRQQHPPMMAAAPRQHHTDPLPMQLDQLQQPGSSSLNGWPLEPCSQHQAGSGPGDLSGYETPLSSGATPEPEGDTEAASRPPEEGLPGGATALVDLVFSGLLRSDVRCCACGNTSTAHDPFRDISLDLHVPRPPRLPPAQPHHRLAAPPAATAVAAAAQGGAVRTSGGAAGAGVGVGGVGAVPGQESIAEVSPAVAAAARRLGISNPLATAGAGGELLAGLREATPPLVVGMTPSPTPPPSDLLLEYWDNTDNERDTAAGGSRGVMSGREGGAASQATSTSRPLSGATGAEEGDDGGLSTALSRGEEEAGEEEEVSMQQQEEGGGAAGTAGGSQEGPPADLKGAAGHPTAVAAGGVGDAVSGGGTTQGGSLTPEPMSEGPEPSEPSSEKSPGASEVGGPVASQSSQQVGAGRAAAAAAAAGAGREGTPELDAILPGAAAGGATTPAGPLQQRLQQHMRESTPQSAATQPGQQQLEQQQQEFGQLVPQQQQLEEEQQPGQGQVQPLGNAAAGNPQGDSPAAAAGAAPSAASVDGVLPAGDSTAAAAGEVAAAAGAGGAVGSSLVRGVSGGLSQLVKGPMTAIKQTAAKLLPTWGAGTAGDEASRRLQQQQQDALQNQLYQQQHQQQLQQQQQQQQAAQQQIEQPLSGSMQQQQDPQQPQDPQHQQQQQPQQLPLQQQPSQEQQQQPRLGTFPSGYSDLSTGMDGQQQQEGAYDMSAMQQYSQQYQEYDPQQQQMYMEGWGVLPGYQDGSGFPHPAAYGAEDWMQQAAMYDSGGGYIDGAAAAAAAVPPAGGKGVKGASGPKPRQTRCGNCKYCLNRHLKKGCEANKKLREEAKAAAKAQARHAAEERATAQRLAAQRAAVNIAATAAAEADPAAAAAHPVGGPAGLMGPGHHAAFAGPGPASSAAAAAGVGAVPSQPTHPLQGMQLHPGATAGAGWAHPGGGAASAAAAVAAPVPLSMLPQQQHQQQFHSGSYYAGHHHQQQGQVQTAAGAAAGTGYPQPHHHHGSLNHMQGSGAVGNAAVGTVDSQGAVHPAGAVGAAVKPSKAAASSAAKAADKLVSAAMTAGLLKKRDDKGRFYRKEHLQVWARLLYERGQLSSHSLPAVTPDAAAVAAAAQDAAMAAGTADWPLPPWMQPTPEPAPPPAPAAAAATAGAAARGAAAPVRGSSAPPALKSVQGSKQQQGAAVKKGSSAGAAVGKKAPAVLRMNELSLAGCLRRFVRPERLGAAAHWRCSACGSSAAALKQLSFRRLPLVLCFHVKRFEHGGATGRPRKLDVPLRFPLHGLDMAPFTTSHMLRGLAHAQNCRPEAEGPARGDHTRSNPTPGGYGGTSNGQAAGPTPGREGGAAGGVGVSPSFRQACLYELFGVVSHWGDMSSGHYVSYIKCEGAWYLINDPWVVAVTEADVAGVQAYMLFYAQEHLFGTGSSGELAEAQRRQRADAAAAVVAAAAAASAQAAGVKQEGAAGGGVQGVGGEGGVGVQQQGHGGAGAGKVTGQGAAAAGGGGLAVKREPGL